MFGTSEDLVYVLFLFWGPALLLTATIPGQPRVVVSILAAGGFLYAWHWLMGANPLGLVLAAIILGVGWLGRKRNKNRDPEAGKLLLIPFMLLFSAVAWAAMWPVLEARLLLRQLPPISQATVGDRSLHDLDKLRQALSQSVSCGEVKNGAPLPMVLEAGGRKHEFIVFYCQERPGLVVALPHMSRPLIHSPELLEQVEQTGVKVPR